nr:hypothetical protein GCM10010200_015540 [Actinomadura rugatobispora]
MLRAEPAFVLRPPKGEVLRLTWDLMDFDAAELWVGEQPQQVRWQLLRLQVKTETPETAYPSRPSASPRSSCKQHENRAPRAARRATD